MNSLIIVDTENKLKQAGAGDVETYIKKLRDNAGNLSVLDDLLEEGNAALMLLRNGFSVSMRESPDLAAKFGTDHFYAEVKHFRTKKQDAIDNANMKNVMQQENHVLTTYGNTVPTERITAWRQIVKVARRKVDQYNYDSSYILIIRSSSQNCIEEVEVQTAVNFIKEAIKEGHCLDMTKMNGILFVSKDFNISQGRKVYFYQIPKATGLGQNAIDLLNSIRIY